MKRIRIAAVLLGLGPLAVAIAGLPMRDGRALRDSLRHLPPNMRFYYLQEGWHSRKPTPAAEGRVELRLRGKWGGGPSVKVTGRDSLVYLSRGSEVVVVNFADTANPRILSYIQVNGLVSRSVLVGNRLYVGTTGSDPKYIEVFDVSSPASPAKLGEVQTRLSDLDVVDTMAYVIARDSLRIFSFADPANPRQVGACRDSGYDISVYNGYAYVGDRWGLYVIDATNPASPHRVASWGDDVISVRARNTICCVTTGNPNQPDELNFSILDVRVPSAPYRIGYLANAGAYDMFLAETLAFLSGYYTGGHVFRILDISDSTQPTLIGSSPTPGEHMGVWVRLPVGKAYVADRFKGLTVMDIRNLVSPAVDTSFLGAGIVEDVCVAGNRAYVGAGGFGLTILDVSSPDHPVEVGHLDSTRNMVMDAVVVRDSFAFTGWQNRPLLRSIDVSDPTDPKMAGGANVTNDPRDVVLCDSFLYIAEDNRFQVVNVARPRSPVLVGSCNLPYNSFGLDVEDTLAYVGNGTSLQIVSIARPTSPYAVGSWTGGIAGVDVVDTIAYLTASGYCFAAVSVARPSSPWLLDSLYLGVLPSDVVVVDTLAYAGGGMVYIISVADPRHLRLVGTWTSPYWIKRLRFQYPYLYAVCGSAGVCILESLETGIGESGRLARARATIVAPNPTTGWTTVALGEGRYLWAVRDIAGRVALRGDNESGRSRLRLNLSAMPPGVYVVELLGTSGPARRSKVVKQ